MTGQIHAPHTPVVMTGQIHAPHTPVDMIGGYYLTAIIVFEANDIILPQVAARLNFYNF